MFKKSLWFAIVMSLFVIGANFVDAKGGSSGGGGFSSGSRSSFSSGSSGFSSGSRSSFSSGSSSSSSGFSSGSKATAPSNSSSGFSSGSKSSTGFFGFGSGSKSSETPTSTAPAVSKPDMMSKSVQQEKSNNVYNSADKPAASGIVNAGGLPPSVIGGRQSSATKETVIIRERDRSSGRSGSFFFVPVWLGGSGSGSDHTVIVNNGQPTQETPGYNNNTAGQNTEQSTGRGFLFWFCTFCFISLVIWVLVVIFKRLP